MGEDFFKFPRTPHLWWPLDRAPKDDRVLDSAGIRELLSGEVIVEEKIDGANIGLSLDKHDEIRVQNRGSWVDRGTHAQFNPIWNWISQRKPALTDVLQNNRILFGEWCFAVHTVRYDSLPDWFLGFDVYDVDCGKFWSTQRRDELLNMTRICPVPRLRVGRTAPTDLQDMLRSEHSRFGKGPIQGLYIRREGPEWLEARAKLVRPDFLMAIDGHWSSRPIERNKVIESVTPMGQREQG